MSALGVGLALWSGYVQQRDVGLATGSTSPEQAAFFVGAATRPDVATFFRKLTPQQRLAMARNIGRYSDPELAQLCGVLLGDFDSAARMELTTSLARIARAHPDVVAKQLSQKGSFQFLGVGSALRSVGDSALPFVASELHDGAAAMNAENLLVEFGAPSVPYVLPLLSDPELGTRIAAEDTVGKLRARAATVTLERVFGSARGSERESALIALAAIGDPRSEALFADVLGDVREREGSRSEAAFGLGVSGSSSAARVLWRFASDSDSNLRDSVVDALVLCGTAALEVSGVSEDVRLRVASRLTGPVADGVIRDSLARARLMVRAAAAAAGRSALAPDLARALAVKENAENGDLAEAAVESLETTAKGRRVLVGLRGRPELAGFLQRGDYLRAHRGAGTRGFPAPFDGS